METENPNTLYVRMFGSFQMRYNGHLLIGEKQKDTHFTNLMQILIHNRLSGVSRDYLEDVLLGDRDVDNRHQALQTIVYKSKKKLKKMGLPDENYIYLEKGGYHWTERIPVEEDASVFDELCKKAGSCTDEEGRLDLCLKICYLYQGEFFSTYSSVLWAAAEARRYSEQFFECVEYAASVLRKKEDWVRLEELGRYVTQVAPLCDWESLTMEALVERGQYDEARKLYADTVEIYMRELGVRPSANILERMERLGNQIQYSYEVLDQIQERLQEDLDQAEGGYQCSYPVFCSVYHIIVRMMERNGQSVYLMLCTLTDSKGNPMKAGERTKELSARLKETIRTSVRRGDIINQYGSGQFLVLLINTTREDCDFIKERINQRFLTGRQRISVQYHVNSVICDF